MCVVTAAGAPARFYNLDRWLWVPAFAGTTTLFFASINDPSLHPRAQPSGQDRLPDGGVRQSHHLSRARRTLEPGRASVPFARSEGGRPHRAPDGEPPRLQI